MSQKKYWIITDPHFNNKGLIEHGLRKPGFEEKIISGIERCVKPGDILINLGDLGDVKSEFFKRYINIHKGKNWLILGNHDSKSVAYHIDLGFDFVAHQFELLMFGNRILFTHLPEPGCCACGNYSLNIHGHFHNNSLETIRKKDQVCYQNMNSRQYLICMESNMYQPFELGWIVKDFRKNGNLLYKQKMKGVVYG